MILCDREIELALKERRIVIEPLPDPAFIDSMAVDLRLGGSLDRYRPLASQLRKIKWILLNETDYDALIASLRKAGFDQPAFWCIERFWHPWDDEPAMELADD